MAPMNAAEFGGLYFRNFIEFLKSIFTGTLKLLQAGIFFILLAALYGSACRTYSPYLKFQNRRCSGRFSFAK